MNANRRMCIIAIRPAFMYLPACLMSQTGGLSTCSPRMALSNKGSVAEIGFGCATVSDEYETPNNNKKNK